MRSRRAAAWALKACLTRQVLAGPDQKVDSLKEAGRSSIATRVAVATAKRRMVSASRCISSTCSPTFRMLVLIRSASARKRIDCTTSVQFRRIGHDIHHDRNEGFRDFRNPDTVGQLSDLSAEEVSQIAVPIPYATPVTNATMPTSRFKS